MARKLKLHPHLNSDELEARYRAAQDTVEHGQWQVIWLLSKGKASSEIAEVTGYCVDWIRKIVRRYNAGGPAAIGDGRHQNPGQERLLSAEQDAELLSELEKAAAAGKAWNSIQVAAWMSAKLGRTVRQARGWDTLQRLNFSTKSPRPRHAKASPQAQDQFKKRLS